MTDRRPGMADRSDLRPHRLDRAGGNREIDAPIHRVAHQGLVPPCWSPRSLQKPTKLSASRNVCFGETGSKHLHPWIGCADISSNQTQSEGIALSSDELPADAANAQGFADSKFGPEAVVRLRAAFDRSQHPMLIADDQRRWVTGNGAACDLLGIAPEDVPWRRMDEFTPPSERTTLEQQWAEFLANGEAEGWYQLYIPHRGAVPIEFSATANVLPARHLSVFMPPDDEVLPAAAESPLPRGTPWTPVVVADGDRLRLTEREREVMTLVASGLQGGDIAEHLFLSPETVKSHVHNAMGRLNARTRAHAVAIALVTGQITFDT